MAEAVVDELEAVEVEKEDGEVVVLVATPAGHGLPEPVEEQVAVGQAREGIVQGVVEDLLLRTLARGDVGLRPRQPHRPRSSVADDEAAAQDEEEIAVLVPNPVFALEVG